MSLGNVTLPQLGAGQLEVQVLETRAHQRVLGHLPPRQLFGHLALALAVDYVAGAVAIFGNVLAGRTSDTVGRRPTLACGLLLCGAAFIAFYNSSGWLLPATWIAALFGFFVVEVLVNTVSGELFPTSCRSTAATLRTVFGILVSAAGLAVEGALFALWGSHALAISVMLLTILAGLPAVWWLLRETAHQELH